MCMASIGHESKGLNFGAFVLGGRTYQRMGQLQPDTSQQHSSAQIYMLDVDNFNAFTTSHSHYLASAGAALTTQIDRFIQRGADACQLQIQN